jgi:aconitate hydratase
MSPEFGSTAAMFPIDDVTLDYLRLTGRSDENVALVESYAKEQGLWHDPSREIKFSEYLELDLSTVVPSISGPKRPQDRIILTESKAQFREDLRNYVKEDLADGSLDEAIDESFPASDSPSFTASSSHLSDVAPHAHGPKSNGRPSNKVSVKTADGREFELDHGAVSIASITSCTNTSNPSVMLAAALLARNAVDKGLTSKPWVKTSVAPGSKVVTDYYNKSGLTPYLEKLGFYIVGYGCATCIGNSGPLDAEISEAIQANDLSVTAVLSGNRNFEGRINPDVKMNYLASPPLVIAYALAGSMDFDFDNDALGQDEAGNDVFLKDIWPNPVEVQEVIDSSIDKEMFARGYEGVFEGDDRWKALDTPAGDTFAWDEKSTYVRKPPYFEGMKAQPEPVQDITGARVLLKLGDSVTTDHISPAGSFKSDTPAGQYLLANGVERKDFNSYGSRRGNHEVMIRGTFANIRIKNQLLDGVEGGFTRDFTQADGPQAYVYDAAQNYQAAGTALVVLAGKEYGSGSSRDWAAKGTALLGVKAVVAESYERIHRSNLIGMGVLPLQYPAGQNAASLGLTGTETYAVEGVTALNDGTTPKTLKVTATAEDGSVTSFDAVLRIDTPGEADYYRNGGILQYVLRQISAH